jgi:hypothetical protein
MLRHSVEAFSHVAGEIVSNEVRRRRRLDLIEWNLVQPATVFDSRA